MEEMNETFVFEDENGKDREASVITRMGVEGTDVQYIIFSIDDDTDTRDVPEDDKQAIIMAARIEKDAEGNETYVDIEDDEEKDAVFEAFNEAYKNVVNNNLA